MRTSIAAPALLAVVLLLAGCSSSPASIEGGDPPAAEAPAESPDTTVEEPAAEEPAQPATAVPVAEGFSVPDRVGDFTLITREMWDEFSATVGSCSGFGAPRYVEGDTAYNPPHYAYVNAYYTRDWAQAMSQTDCARTADYVILASIGDYLSEAELQEARSLAQFGYDEAGVQCITAVPNPNCSVTRGQFWVSAVSGYSQTLFGDQAVEQTAAFVAEFSDGVTLP